MKKNFWVLFFLLCAVFFLSQKNALAQEGSAGFSLNPFFQEIELSKDQDNASFSIEVKNSNNFAVIFRLSVLDFGTLDESGGVAFLGEQDDFKYRLASWVSLQNDTLVLEPGEVQSVKGKIENKESLSPGGHYGAIYFKIEDNQTNSELSQEKQVAFNPSFASLLFVRKQGGEIFKLGLKNVETTKSIFVFPDVQKLRFQNSGNVHLVPRGLIEIRDPFGKLVYKGIINLQSSIILPETFKIFPVQLEKIEPAFFPGKYTTSIKYRFDGKEDFETSEKTFIYVSWKFLLCIGILLTFAMILGMKLGRKNLKNNLF